MSSGEPRALPRLHVVTDDRVLGADAFSRTARQVMEAGGDRVALHVRGPGSAGRRVHDRAAALRTVAAETGALLVVNDRVDVALALGLEAVHLGERSLPVEAARALLPSGTVVGVSVHDPEGACCADPGTGPEADYLAVGTIFATPSHPGRGGAGPERLREVGAVTDRPLLAIGGITPARVVEATEAGAYGVAVLRSVWDAPDPAAAVHALLERLEAPVGVGGTEP